MKSRTQSEQSCGVIPKRKYKIIEKNDPPKERKLYKLTEWSEKFLGNKKELAHGFRILRNIIHEDNILTEQDAKETIRHVSAILNLLYPFEQGSLTIVCNLCKNKHNYFINKDKYYIGSILQLTCDKANSIQNLVLLP